MALLFDFDLLYTMFCILSRLKRNAVKCEWQFSATIEVSLPEVTTDGKTKFHELNNSFDFNHINGCQ